MALRQYIPSQDHFVQFGEQLRVTGFFDIVKTTGAVGAQSDGRGWSVVRAAAGTYDITFEGPIYARLSFLHSVEDTETPSGTDIFSQAGAYASLVQRVYTIEGGAVGDVTTAVRVHFTLEARTRNAL